jgi:hypothetical protein
MEMQFPSYTGRLARGWAQPRTRRGKRIKKYTSWSFLKVKEDWR